MKNRKVIRHDSAAVPDKMTSVLIVLPDKTIVETRLVNICSHGIRTSIPNSCTYLPSPRKNDIFKVVFKSYGMELTGMCIYSLNNADDCTTLGIYFINPNDQNILHNMLENLLPAKMAAL